MRKIFIAKAVAYLIAAIAAISSFGHQVHLLALAHLDPLFGVVPSEYVTPTTVDALAFIALVVRYADVKPTVRKAALLPLILAGSMSIAANVAVAHNLVGIVVGVWTVAAYVIAEVFVSKLDANEKATQGSTIGPAVAAPVTTAVRVPVPAPHVAESPEVLAYRAARARLNQESAIPLLNVKASNGNGSK